MWLPPGRSLATDRFVTRVIARQGGCMIWNWKRTLVQLLIDLAVSLVCLVLGQVAQDQSQATYSQPPKT